MRVVIGDPNVPSAQNKYYSFKLTTTIPSTKTALSTGAIGLWKDGVEIFNGFDAVTYNTYWHRNAYYWEGSSFDSCLGHPGINYYCKIKRHFFPLYTSKKN